MVKLKDLMKPKGKFKIQKFFLNKRTNQITIALPRKKLRGNIPLKIEVSYW